MQRVTKLKHINYTTTTSDASVKVAPVNTIKSLQTSGPKIKITFVIPFAMPGSGNSFCWAAIK